MKQIVQNNTFSKGKGKKAPVKKATGGSFRYWLKKHRYYHNRIRQFYSVHVPAGSSVLHVNCRDGYLLDTLKPSIGIGIDEDSALITQAKKRYPGYAFYAHSLEDLSISYSFDYILLSFSAMEVEDIQLFLEQLHRFCHPGTRIILESYSYLWAPVLWLIKKLRLRRPTTTKNWVAPYDLRNFAYLAGFDTVTYGEHTLMPIYLPLISTFLNAIVARLPLFNRLCLHNWLVVRPVRIRKASETTVSIIIPCKNEAGNIEAAVIRCPQLGKKTELIFVEGHSKDDTLQEIKRVAEKYPEKHITCFTQQGKGKGDAVRTGFSHATGDVLMIQDADLTAPPEELPKFFQALVSGKGEFINGSRLVYGMERQAMMYVACISNHFFSWLLSWIMGQRIKDSLCGTKVLWKNDYERIACNRQYIGLHDPFGDFDLLFGAARLHLKIIDVPVHYKDRTYGKTNINRFKEVWFLLWMCARACWFMKLV